jgi:hypothetical protein
MLLLSKLCCPVTVNVSVPGAKVVGIVNPELLNAPVLSAVNMYGGVERSVVTTIGSLGRYPYPVKVTELPGAPAYEPSTRPV